MIKFDGRIVQFGFGAVGKSFYEKLPKEIKFNENNYYVITMDQSEFDAYVNLGGIVSNFLVKEVTRENFAEVFEPYLSSGDLLIFIILVAWFEYQFRNHASGRLRIRASQPL